MTKIVLITGYFYPEDTAIGLYNTQLTEHLQSKGYEVQVLTGFPCYPQWRIDDDYIGKSVFHSEFHNGVKIYRYKQYVPKNPTFIKRILLLTDFTFGTLINVFKIKECDLVLNVIPHSSAMFLGWILKVKTKAKMWNHVQDFEFDAVYETGLLSKKHLLKNIFFKTLFKIESILFNKADLNSTISHHMMDKLKTKTNTKTYYFPNWIELNKINPVNHTSEHHYFKTQNFKILYSGNIGDKQDWEFFIEFAYKLKDLNVEIVVVGDGAKKNWLAERLKALPNVNYYSPVQYNELSKLLCSTDLHILFQKDSVVDSVMPSKLLGMMASAKPSLITGSSFSEVKTLLEQSSGGFYVFEDKITQCMTIIQQLMDQTEQSKIIGLNARHFVTEKFSSQNVLTHFEYTLKELIAKK